jgi:acyl-CoA synthetase (AMP-forming)/AMP-acid ligase II
MNNHMMQQPLLISWLLAHAEQHHGEQEVVSRRVEGGIERQNYRALARRSRRIAAALGRIGLAPGERVGTLAWNGHRHMELYYAVSGAGLVLHPMDPQQSPDQLAWIANHAEDKALFFHLSFLPLAEALAPHLGTVRHWVVMTDRANMPPSSRIQGLLCYEELLEGEGEGFQWPLLEENSPSSLSYTLEKPDHPKGVLYSHRSTLLHTFAACMPDAFNLSARDCILPVVPMFRYNAGGLPYAACMVGAKLVLPGAALDGASLYELIENEGVTVAAGHPNVWRDLLAHVQANHLGFSTMRRVIIGGAPCPPALLETLQQRYFVDVLHSWGKTELSPLGTVNTFKPRHQNLSHAECLAVQSKQGRSLFGIDMKIIDAQGQAMPWDGKTTGDLLVRGPWVLQRYFKHEGGDPLVYNDGQAWFPTGDVCTIDADGFMQIVQRA